MLLRLAVDAPHILSDRRGIGVYARALLSRMAEFRSVELTIVMRGLFPQLRHRAIARELGTDRFAVSSRIPNDADVAWYPWIGTFRECPVPVVATLHDCAMFAYPSVSRRVRLREQTPFRRIAERARRFIADSEFAKNELMRYLGVEGKRIDVVSLAVDAEFTPGTPGAVPEALQSKPYILYVGAPDERKNLDTLVRAHARAYPNADVSLVCVTSAQVPGAICLTGLSPEALRDAYRGALCFAMPSIYEGFGLPALEALACGTPVIVSRAASLPEVCADAARYVEDPLDVGAWVSAIQEVTGNPALRASMRERGLAQASRFSWDATAEQTFESLCRL